MDVGAAQGRANQVDGVKILQAANDLLLFRRYEEVLRVCRLGVDRIQDIIFPPLQREGATQGRDDGGEGGAASLGIGFSEAESSREQRARQRQQEAKREYLESVCVLAMQAYAELDRWDQVLPFLLATYGDISKLPPRIVLMCIMLFSKVHSFAEAEAFSSQWLRAQNGWSIHQYRMVLELYIQRVFVSRGRWKAAREYVEANGVLTPEKKMGYLKNLTELQQQRGGDSMDGCQDSKTSQSGNFLLNLVLKLRSFFASRVSPAASSGLHRIQNLAIISVFLYLLLFRSNTSIPTGASHASLVWSGVLGVWRSLFAPFHVVSHQA